MPTIHRRRPAAPAALLVAIAIVAQLVLPFAAGVGGWVAPAVAAAGDVGFEGPSLSGSSAPTGQKPQSKLWFNDGSWWGVLWSTSARKFTIWGFNWDANTWTDTGTVVDERSRSSADALWTGSELFVGSAMKETVTSGDRGARILRYSYSPSTRSYSLNSGFPITVASGPIESLVIDQDSLQRVWATWTEPNGSGGRRVMVVHSAPGGQTFEAPFALPVTDAGNLDADDTSTLVAYDNDKIGVLWSNQTTDNVYWASHVDVADDGEWSLAPALSGRGYADDHLNIKSLQADASGRVFAAVKTSLNDIYPATSQQPLILLLVLDGTGGWRRHTVSRVSENQTRPIVLVSPQNRKVFVFAASPCCSGGVIYGKEADLDNPDFASGQGDAFISLAADTTINNPTSTKQPLTLESGALVLAGDDHSHRYVFNKIAFGAAPGAPNTTIGSGPSDSTNLQSATFQFSSDDPAATFACQLDSSAPVPCTSPTSYAGLAEGLHQFQVTASTVNGSDPTPASRSWAVDLTAPDTVVDTKPADGASGSAVFTFHATETASTFDCRLDDAAAAPCTSPLTIDSVGVGPHTFTVAATDSAGNTDPTPVAVGWTQAEQSALFSDDFETGTLAAWDSVVVAADASAAVVPGSGADTTKVVALSATTTSKSAAYLRESFSPDLDSFQVSGDFRILAEGPSRANVPLVRFFDASGARMLSLYRQNQSGDRMYVAYGGSTFLVSGTLPLGQWTHIELNVTAGTGGRDVEVVMGGVSVYRSGTTLLDSPVDRVQIGNDTARQAFSLQADNIAVLLPTSGGPPAQTPDTTITAGPSGAVASASATFSFGSNVVGATFECALDGEPFGSCSSPLGLTGLADGSHEFSVRATAGGLVDPTPAIRTWMVDTLAPAVVSTNPGASATDVNPSTAVTATFSESMAPASLTTGTFRLVSSGGASVNGPVTYDSAARTARLTPTSPLAAGTVYTVRVSATVADGAGNTLGSEYVWSFTTAATPPPSGTIIRASTASAVNSTAAPVIAVPAPAGSAPGDVLVACVALNGGTIATAGVPAGWEPIASVTSITNPRVFGFVHVVGATEPTTYEWRLTSSVASSAGIGRYTGVDTIQPLDAPATMATGPSANTAAIPGVSAATVGAMLVGCMAVNSSSTGVRITEPAGMTAAWDLAGKRQQFADEVLADAGSSGSRTWSFSSSREWAGWLVPLRPR